jgi:hypothetical protein
MWKFCSQVLAPHDVNFSLTDISNITSSSGFYHSYERDGDGDGIREVEKKEGNICLTQDRTEEEDR